MTTRLLLTGDEALPRAALRILLDSGADIHVVAEAAGGCQILQMARAHRPDVVLMYCQEPDLHALSAIRSDPDLPTTRILLLLTTRPTEELVAQAVRAGVSGILDQDVSADSLLSGIRAVATGDSLLSPAATKLLITRFLRSRQEETVSAIPEPLRVLTARERQVMTLIAAGKSNTEIASGLAVSPLTVRTHVNRVRTKLGAQSRTQVVVLAYHHGLVGSAQER